MTEVVDPWHPEVVDVLHTDPPTFLFAADLSTSEVRAIRGETNRGPEVFKPRNEQSDPTPGSTGCVYNDLEAATQE